MIEELISRTQQRVARQREIVPPAHMEKMAERLLSGGGHTGAFKTFSEALQQRGLTVIADVSGSDDPLDMAYECEAGDADIIAYSTEPYWHGGSDSTLMEIRDEVSVPLLRRDIVIDPYQIFEAKTLGADALVLSCALAGDDLGELLRLCGLLQIDALVEASDASELSRALDAGARIVSLCAGPVRALGAERCLEGAMPGEAPDHGTIAINAGADASGSASSDPSHDPGFMALVEEEARVLSKLPDGVLYVAQLGISSVEDARTAQEAGACAVIAHKALLSAADDDARTQLIRGMKGE